MRARLAPARLIAVVSGLLAFYSLARVSVLFFEALSTVQSARAEDETLLELCTSGRASGSAKMREACLKAQAERASPIVFKAVVQAVSTAFKDFADSVGSPFKLMVVVLFMLSSVALPTVPWARLLFGQPYHEYNEPIDGVHYIGFAPPPDRRGFVRRRWDGARRRLKGLRRHPRIDELDELDEDVEPGVTTIDMSQGATGGGVDTPESGWDEIRLGAAAGHSKWE